MFDEPPKVVILESIDAMCPVMHFEFGAKWSGNIGTRFHVYLEKAEMSAST
jgi:hypothetical protein